MGHVLFLFVLVAACRIPDESFSRPEPDPTCHRPGFPAGPLPRTAAGPYALAVADVSGDGRPDLVAATMSGFVSVLIASDDGSFQPRADYLLGGAPSQIQQPMAVIDVNRDARPDVVVAYLPQGATSDVIGVLLNKGDGTFQPKTDYPLTTSPSVSVRQMKAVDVTGDGNFDLVVALSNNTQLGVLLGTGDGRFGGNIGPSVGVGQEAVAVGDVNGDNQPDLLVANISLRRVRVLFNSGGGNFAPSGYPDPYTSSDPRAIDVADVDGDGVLDLIVATNGSGLFVEVEVKFNRGDGSFGLDGKYPTGSGALRSFALVDINGDGRRDLVLPIDEGNNTRVAIMIGDPFGSFMPASSYPTGQQDIKSLGIADLDDNGKLDLVAASSSTDKVSVLLNSGTGAFSMHVDYLVGQDPRSVVIADGNGDAKPDVAVANLSSDTISLLHNNGGGAFRVDASAGEYAVNTKPVSLVIADVSGDSRPDVIAVNETANVASVLLGSGDGTFLGAIHYTTGMGPRSVALADVNHDTRLDMVVANAAASTVSVLLGNGAGHFETNTDFATHPRPSAVAVADVSGDGKLDLVVGFDGGVDVLVGNSGGQFPIKVDFPTGNTVAVAIADLNADGKLDIVAANAAPSTVSVLLGIGNGTFQPKVDLPIAGPATSISVADLDDDGDLDLACANGASSASVLLGLGDGTFLERADYPTGRAPTSIAAADVDGDRKLDLVTANAIASTVSVLRGNGDGTFREALDYQAGAGPQSIAIADVNGDLFPDFVTANAAANTVSVMLGACLPEPPAARLGSR